MFPRVVEYIDELTKDYAQAAKIDFMKHAREMARLKIWLLKRSVQRSDKC